jgi:hypothetical protein
MSDVFEQKGFTWLRFRLLVNKSPIFRRAREVERGLSV